jgi:hypothetical protein
MKTISENYIELNRLLHSERADYGTSGSMWASKIAERFHAYQCQSALDYGAGKQTLKKSLPNLPIRCYDPCVEEISASPQPAHLVSCTDVLEHIEPDYIDSVLDHIAQLTERVAFLVIATRPAVKVLPDGRNAHLIQEPASWWLDKLFKRFRLMEFVNNDDQEFFVTVESLTFNRHSLPPPPAPPPPPKTSIRFY